MFGNVAAPGNSQHLFGAVDGGVDEQAFAPTEAAAEAVKELQRTDPGGREQWGLYCDTHRGGIRDPSKHSAQFLQSFLDQYHAGHRMESSKSVALAELVKEGQRKSPAWKQVWASYCQHYGGNTTDPTKHEQSFIVGFMDFLGQSGMMSLDQTMPMMSMPMAATGRPMKRPRGPVPMAGPGIAMYTPMSGWAGPLGSTPSVAMNQSMSSGDPMKDALVARIKAYQRSGEEQKQQWWDFADKILGGVRDPMRHDKGVLEGFISQNGVQ